MHGASAFSLHLLLVERGIQGPVKLEINVHAGVGDSKSKKIIHSEGRRINENMHVDSDDIRAVRWA